STASEPDELGSGKVLLSSAAAELSGLAPVRGREGSSVPSPWPDVDEPVLGRWSQPVLGHSSGAAERPEAEAGESGANEEGAEEPEVEEEEWGVISEMVSHGS